jgi:hypothetical protein
MTRADSTAPGRFCEACQAIPQSGYCNLAGCPTTPDESSQDDLVQRAERMVMALEAWAKGIGPHSNFRDVAGAFAKTVRLIIPHIKDVQTATACCDICGKRGGWFPSPTPGEYAMALCDEHSGNWVMVPREPTQAMLDAAVYEDSNLTPEAYVQVWASMLAAGLRTEK